MTSEIAGFWIAICGGAMTLLATTLSKEQKVSEFRQAWIDGLRDDLTTFLTSARAFARAADAKVTGAMDPFDDSTVSELRIKTASSLYRIRLRLNPCEAAHGELFQSLKHAVEIQNSVLDGTTKEIQPILVEIEQAADQACRVLKLEWEVVKKGESAFRTARLLSWALIGGALALLAFSEFSQP